MTFEGVTVPTAIGAGAGVGAGLGSSAEAETADRSPAATANRNFFMLLPPETTLTPQPS
jgi:hypothetical protein